MKVILTKEVKKLGKVGDIVETSDGYARNYLFPRSLAREATEGSIKDLGIKKAAEKKRKDGEKEEALALVKKIEAIIVKLEAKGGENGRLFGSITSSDISDALEKQHKIKIDKKKINLSSPIKQTGEHIIELRVYPEIIAKLKVEITI